MSSISWSETVLDSRGVEDLSAPVVANVPVNGQYFHLTVGAVGPALQAQAGQFFFIACPRTAADQPYLRRPMSVYRIDRRQMRIEFLYKISGTGTRALSTLRAGDTLSIFGPLGRGFCLQPRWRNIVVLGRGVGLATLAPLADQAAESGIGVNAILSARSEDFLMSVERFTAGNARVQTVFDTDGSSDPSNVERILLALIDAGAADAFFTCGSNRLVQIMKRLGARFGVPGEVAMEQQMACGLGMCFCCVRKFNGESGIEARRVCVDGPVFKLDEVLTW